MEEEDKKVRKVEDMSLQHFQNELQCGHKDRSRKKGWCVINKAGWRGRGMRSQTAEGGAQRRTREHDGEKLMKRVRKGQEGGNNIDSHRSWSMMGEAREERKGCTH